ncbi:MAG: GNAT family N-acetyltransferase [Chloroflexota bacterium]|nr:GNAT family N-acetyltransferase [Chloroflexota bacterium]
MDDITLRRATADDAETITIQRRRMFEDMGVENVAGMDRMDVDFLPYVRERLVDARYCGWLAVARDEAGAERIIGGAGLVFLDWIPGYQSARPQRPYILNVYVQPDYRRRGIAPRLVNAILDHCKEEGWGYAWLHASEQGYPVYESMGFIRTREMGFGLDQPGG